jgi:hypothetical protein
MTEEISDMKPVGAQLLIIMSLMNKQLMDFHSKTISLADTHRMLKNSLGSEVGRTEKYEEPPC